MLGSYPRVGAEPPQPTVYTPAQPWRLPYPQRQWGPCRSPTTGGTDRNRRLGPLVGGRVLVLNATYEPINVCTVRRADGAAAEGEGRGASSIGPHDLHWARGSMPRAGRDPARHLRARPARHAPAQDHAPRRLRPRRLDSASTAARARASPSTTSSRARRAAARTGRTSSPRARRATAARATGCPHQVDMHPRAKPRMPQPATSSSTSPSPTIPAAWRQYLLPEARLSRRRPSRPTVRVATRRRRRLAEKCRGGPKLSDSSYGTLEVPGR